METKDSKSDVDVVPSPDQGPDTVMTTPQLMSVRRALDQAAGLYGKGELEAAVQLASQIVSARPRLAEAQNLFGVILSAQGKKAEAVKAFTRATRLDPLNAQFFSNLGEIERQRGKLQHAALALNEALRLNPANPQALNNLGIVHFDRKEFGAAAECYAAALVKLPSYPEAHNNLGNALRALGRLEDAIDHYQQAILIRENYPEAYNNMASVLRDLGQLPEAEHAYRKAIALRSDYVDAYLNLAGLLEGHERADEALRLLGEALKIDPRHAASLLRVARIQLRKMNYEQAEQAARLALSIDLNSADAHAALGQILHETDRIEDAIRHLEIALRLKPGLIEVNSLYAICLKSLGRTEEARKQFKRTLAIAPAAFGIYANLADLETFTRDSPHLRDMEKFLSEAVEPNAENYMPLYFALGKAYDDIGEYSKAFQHFRAGATVKRASIKYDEAQTLNFFDSVREMFSESFMKISPFPGRFTQVPVFIVGMPRSGSTLVEQVISSHPMTFGAGEIKEFSRQLNMLRGRFPGLPKYPFMVQKMNVAQFAMVADGYLTKLTALAPDAARITDKLLTNFFFVGLLHMLYPKAKFIHTRRNPLDTCLSVYTKLFKDEMPHSYDLGELGRYYRKYDSVMAHWAHVLPPGVMKTVDYEDVVRDLPSAARDIIGFLDLPWDEACLKFHVSARAVKTASVMQVRRPVYDSSVHRWKLYGDALKPLIDALDHHE